MEINHQSHITQFLGLFIDNILSWKTNDQLPSKLCEALYAIRAVKSFMSQ